MKAVILAGGRGSRLSEETHLRPKPMVEIGGKPILWHIMKIYSAHGIHDFIICLGYKGYLIKEYMVNYALHQSDVHVDVGRQRVEILGGNTEPWRITLADTGEDSMTGGRLKRVGRYLDDEDFCMTYGDGVGNIDVTALIRFHREQGTQATMTATRPPGRFGILTLKENTVTSFREKPSSEGWINGGFFVLNPKVLDRIEGDATIWEREPLETLARDRQIAAYRHDGFWRPMDTLRDKNELEALWDSGNAPWKIW
ncbi:MAG: glucose-1-phosphate cytidylyltransferase [Magnetococcales bacterium]|nr:glucose-1-phosphate cytidylyltransferase [Magnetococcales bacterium]